MTTFLISQNRVHDPELMKQYGMGSRPLAQKHGAQTLVRTEHVEALDGHHDGRRLMVMSFPNIREFRAFWNSPEYQELRKLRLAAAESDVWLVTDEPEA